VNYKRLDICLKAGTGAGWESFPQVYLWKSVARNVEIMILLLLNWQLSKIFRFAENSADFGHICESTLALKFSRPAADTNDVLADQVRTQHLDVER
jgi:hypothetical protein